MKYDHARMEKHVAIAMSAVAICFGLIQTWWTRYSLNPDGLSYIDLSDNFIRGEFAQALNAYWSPLYPLFLGLFRVVFRATPDRDFQVIHLANFVMYVLALGSFGFLIRQWSAFAFDETQADRTRTDRSMRVAFNIVGYALFIWSSLTLIGTSLVTPDLSVAFLIYLATGVAIISKRNPASLKLPAALGVILGVGYFAKAAVFPIAPIVIVCAAMGRGDRKRAFSRMAIGLICFAVTASPLIICLSLNKQRLTFGDSGHLNYAWDVNHTAKAKCWQGEDPAGGIPKHPVRQVCDDPRIFEFATPIDGTYPPWKDPSYWNDGTITRFRTSEQIYSCLVNVYVVLDTLGGVWLPISVITVLIAAGGEPNAWLRRCGRNWYILVPASAAFLMYCLVHIEPRFVAAFLVLIVLSLFTTVSLPEARWGRRLLWAAVTVVAFFLIVLETAFHISTDKIHLSRSGMDSHYHLNIADRLAKKGLGRGDRIACIGEKCDNNYWARLAGLQIVAEIPPEDADDFWLSFQSEESQGILTLKSFGVRGIVSEEKPPSRASAGRWERIKGSDVYVLLLE